MEKVQPRLFFSAAGTMLFWSAWLLPSQVMAASNPTPIDLGPLNMPFLRDGLAPNAPTKADAQSGVGIVTFISSLVTALVIFGIQVSLFALLRNKLARIFKPKTYLVPERERTEPPPSNFFAMIRTVVRFKDREIIKKCGLDAYFFLRYLKTLLIIFIPICAVVLPILIPINYIGGIGQRVDLSSDEDAGKSNTVTGLNTLAWTNIRPENTSRYAAHLLLAILVVIWICAVFFFELRAYIKVRQDYLTSAEHRLRASATTVLLNAVPQKWLSEDALRGLFDVFPGGVRNVWLNRDMTKLLDKVNLREQIHAALENAETELIRAAKKAQLKKQRKDEKVERRIMKLGALSRAERASRSAKRDKEAEELANSGTGEGSGDKLEIPHTVTAGVEESAMEIEENQYHDHDKTHEKHRDNEHGIHNTLTGLTKTTSKVAGGLRNVASKSGKGIEDGIGTTQGFVPLSANSKKSLSLSAQRPGTTDSRATHSPDGSVVSATSTSAIKRQDDVEDHGVSGNTVRKADETDFMDNGRNRFWQFWKPPSGGYVSPVPQGSEAEDYMSAGQQKDKTFWQTVKGFIPFISEDEDEEIIHYRQAFNPENDEQEEEGAEWRKYLKKKHRPTHHLPLFGITWLFGIPGITKRVDTIYHCRKELARLNVEIEEDQKHPERYPLMNSAFVQFNHQVAAHMACQSAVHHLPRYMAPRIIEISPRDVIWDNMAISWWGEGLRAFIVAAIVCVMAFFWTIPVAWTAALSQLDVIVQRIPWLSFLRDANLSTLAKIVAGVLPAAVLGLLLVLVPLVLNFLAGIRGAKTGAQKTEFVQFFYFVFLFMQVFLVVSIATFFTASLAELISNIKAQFTSVENVLKLLARNLPKAANYFFSYMVLQALATSSGTLLQTVSLFFWFVIGPMFDSTARNKWARNTNLNNVEWGTFFPVYTNFACIAIFYCVISPLISIFAIITFGLLWFAQRYAMVYVYRMQRDTGGVLYPRAINQTFTGLYFMQLCMAGLFLLVVDTRQQRPCITHAVIMLVVMILTMIYQYLLNRSFAPLFRYLPITFEDEAVLRDEAFQRAQDSRLGLGEEDDEDDFKASHGVREKSPSLTEGEAGIEMNNLEQERRRPAGLRALKPMKQVGTWAVEGGKHVGGWAKGGGNQLLRLTKIDRNSQAAQYRRQQRKKDLEAQRAMGNALFGGFHDEIEDLTPDERDLLTRHAFLHSALRARRPVVWIPRDDLGISEDEINRTRALSKHIWISNEGTALDSKVRVVYGRHPPDFSEVDVINL